MSTMRDLKSHIGRFGAQLRYFLAREVARCKCGVSRAASGVRLSLGAVPGTFGRGDIGPALASSTARRWASVCSASASAAAAHCFAARCVRTGL